ncbi:hypothetical protein StoSoilB3_07870 [Arthrobacter sp. StoSoilB3]|nr:hypothetical protein NtRootA2_07930 [Arthrobacter sp. NtRootA2]BCW13591.1 hypothetical protein NtRootA4_05700 [Arthrobacter sp. NtRootA4]BCW21927.1 hypothetical protein NtRootC7_07940 [Arthrobacter sp. NtRootC7]BCW26195.1 hypothetical protein NtRootC45_07950 [Arthrobacter sp. NtRootC45]BCW30464.1 hypothetical protein NtRootD5_07950 [Arthrobacter sp. NtRootD5]BCW39252.1 hypothetical protein StoSoilB3_07870 [Arthrobacter sp. StoSoilB3]GGV34799.1 hypothetical protein GCM10010212_23330 [Paenar
MAALTSGALFRTRETVPKDTPAISATSLMVGFRRNVAPVCPFAPRGTVMPDTLSPVPTPSNRADAYQYYVRPSHPVTSKWAGRDV